MLDGTTPDFGRPTSNMNLSKDRLKVDPAYQRVEFLSESNIKKIRTNFAWAKFGALLVSLRCDGSAVIVDGQHRWKAGLELPSIGELPCTVIDCTNLTIEAARQFEAEVFYAINKDRKSMGMLTTFKVWLELNDPYAKRVEGLIHASGRNWGSGSSTGVVSCVGAMMRCLRDKPKGQRPGWQVFPALWFEFISPLCNGYRVHQDIVTGAYCLEQMQDIGVSLTDKRWAARALKARYDPIMDSIKRMSAVYKKNNSKACAVGIANALNKGMQQPRLKGGISEEV